MSPKMAADWYATGVRIAFKAYVLTGKESARDYFFHVLLQWNDAKAKCHGQSAN